MNRYTFVLPSENQNALRLLSICANADYNVIHLVDQNFLQRYTQNFEIRRRVLRIKKITKFKKNTSQSLSLSLSLSTCQSDDAL